MALTSSSGRGPGRSSARWGGASTWASCSAVRPTSSTWAGGLYMPRRSGKLSVGCARSGAFERKCPGSPRRSQKPTQDSSGSLPQQEPVTHAGQQAHVHPFGASSAARGAPSFPMEPRRHGAGAPVKPTTRALNRRHNPWCWVQGAAPKRDPRRPRGAWWPLWSHSPRPVA
jgi:hypothetical protein